MQIFFDIGPSGGPLRFEQPRRIIEAWAPADVPDALEALGRADGWLAGYCSYELGYALEPRLLSLMPRGRRLPLLRFGVFDGPQDAQMPEAAGSLLAPTPAWSADRYAEAFARLHDYIAAGDVYQANLTFPMEANAEGSAAGLYGALAARQPVGHGALIEQEDLPAILCRSPELFFRVQNGMIETKPMKGTMPRALDATQDAANRDWLAVDEKNRAENLMIVDLLRNDLSRVSQAGSVKVPDLFTVESYTTVHQMVSRITARLRNNAGLEQILRALFPCGSITGAPKLRAMEIIRELEPAPRDIYCGSIGWVAPDGRAEFNVAIRTLMLDGNRATLNVGGGVVWDSTADKEYEEALWKARFADMSRPIAS
ncbi:aminodeoxychorismate synthase component I [Qingshengfaniella alkalisoli]|uniref:Aminodeoxychorismate synthase component I n=1 Tax=Qingshengfaniella alkalisoli TaxID=2599296 RepID=A0A5B8IY76_9RHOB|nr:aminodeoxychorismate synthase component I [Qingshengfaniella alkalisoli]QDY69841.1 aminodeoxychorismate synthase component I [Qingshengfaniella alkalisoli]